MPADEAGTPEPRGSGFRQALGGFGAWLRGAGRAINGIIIVRFCKYVFLICCVALTLTIVYDAYSFYVARRDIDSELRSKKVSSLEYLGVLSQRKRALAITALEGRCMERTQLTMFRIFDAQQEEIHAAYVEMMKIKDQIVELVKKSGPGLIDAKKAEDFFNLQRFTLAEFDHYIEPINPEIENNAKYKTFKADILKLRDQYTKAALANAPLLAKIESLIEGKKLEASKYWNMDAIQSWQSAMCRSGRSLTKTKTKLAI